MFYFKETRQTFSQWEIRCLADFLRVEGFWHVGGMTSGDVVYWAENHAHMDAKRLASIGRVDV